MSIIRKCCPICGGRIIVSDLYQVSYDYTIGKRGIISKRFKKSRHASIEASIAACENAPDRCEVYWDCDSFIIDEKGRFLDFKYKAEDGD